MSQHIDQRTVSVVDRVAEDRKRLEEGGREGSR